MSIRFEHIRCPLHRYTFSVKPIREGVERTCSGRVLNLFAGMTRLAVDEWRNDLDPEMPAHSYLDALDFLRGYRGEKFGSILFDPPYAYRKSMERYKGIVCSPFRQLKDEIVKHLQPRGPRRHLRLPFHRHGQKPGFYFGATGHFLPRRRDPRYPRQRGTLFTTLILLFFPLGSPRFYRNAGLNSTGTKRQSAKKAKKTYHEQQHLYH